jgi:hypothetical protein
VIITLDGIEVGSDETKTTTGDGDDETLDGTVIDGGTTDGVGVTTGTEVGKIDDGIDDNGIEVGTIVVTAG